MARICEVGTTAGLVFPATEVEHSWPPAGRAALYGVGLLYCFLGVAIASDIFMGSIERITSKLVQRRGKDGQVRTSKFWNSTVATLTLMALGSSAPEILLAVVDVTKRGFHSGDLGPSTIVGSAAFNLFVIIAVCVAVVPENEVRIIANRPAFYITAVFSFGAYVWMATILTRISPDVVEIWEAVITAALLPALVYVSYLVDKGHGGWIFVWLGLAGQEVVDLAFAGAHVPHCIGFADREVVVPGSRHSFSLEVVVLRMGGHTGSAAVCYHAEPLCSVVGYDFKPAGGQLHFGPGESSQLIRIHCAARAPWRCGCKLLVVLDEPLGNVELDPRADGGDGCAVLTVELQPLASGGHGIKGTLDRLFGLYMLRAGLSEWCSQWRNVWYCLGCMQAQAEASRLDWFLHILALPWKVFFLVIPPTCLFGGWLSFFASLLGVGAITAIVSDLAELFGCVLMIPDVVTAVTFVAMGTSLPDFFASLSAAKEDPTADASILNVTGSNAVNVFLGLGAPWTVAAVYWRLLGEDTAERWFNEYSEVAATVARPVFVVQNRNLAFSVLAFGVICVAALVVLHFRRVWLGGELGGPRLFKVATIVLFAGFWFGWVGIVSWRALRWSQTAFFVREALYVQSVCLVVLALAVLGLLLAMKMHCVAATRERLQRAREAASNMKQFSGSQKSSTGSQESSTDISQDISQEVTKVHLDFPPSREFHSMVANRRRWPQNKELRSWHAKLERKKAISQESFQEDISQEFTKAPLVFSPPAKATQPRGEREADMPANSTDVGHA